MRSPLLLFPLCRTRYWVFLRACIRSQNHDEDGESYGPRAGDLFRRALSRLSPPNIHRILGGGDTLDFFGPQIIRRSENSKAALLITARQSSCKRLCSVRFEDLQR